MRCKIVVDNTIFEQADAFTSFGCEISYEVEEHVT
jgi:hypothetical protein